MLLNPNKTKASVVSRSRTVNLLHGDLVLSRVSICASPNLDILGVKFDSAGSPSKTMCVVFSPVSQGIGILSLVKHALWTPLWCVVAIIHLLSQSLTIVLKRGGLLLNVSFCFLSTRCIRWPDLALIRLSCRCVIDVMLLHCVCCTRLIRIRIIVCSVIFHLLLSKFDIPVLRLQLIHQSLKYEGVERTNLQGVSCRPRRVCVMTFITLCLTPER